MLFGLAGYNGSGDGENYQVFTKTSNGGSSWSSGSINLGDDDLGDCYGICY